MKFIPELMKICLDTIAEGTVAKIKEVGIIPSEDKVNALICSKWETITKQATQLYFETVKNTVINL